MTCSTVFLLLFFTCNALEAQVILKAASDGDLAKVTAIISSDPQQINYKSEKSETLVHSAALGGYLQIIEFAHEKGASLNSLTDSNESPLHYACYMGHLKVVEYLLSNGADIDQKTTYGKTALDLAYSGEHKAVVGLLKDKGAYDAPVPEVDALKLGDNMYRVLVPLSEPPNSIIYRGADSVLVVDTGWFKTSQRIKQYVINLNNGKIQYIVNTHLHPDHKGGNDIADSNTIIIHEGNLEELAGKGVITRAEAKLTGSSGKSFDTYYTLNFNGQQVRLIPSPGVHTDADVIVHFPSSRVVHMGDLLIAESFPSVRLEVDEYIEILEKVMDIFPEGTTLVGGHGKVIKVEDVAGYKTMLVDVLRFVRKGIRQGRKKEDIMTDAYLKKYEPYNTFIPELRADYWIEAVYRKEEERSPDTSC
jgi:glyoxylase-like metal-dependent hydrolase (beta-lactamase superfamily II)